VVRVWPRLVLVIVSLSLMSSALIITYTKQNITQRTEKIIASKSDLL
jgi:hypothetical protein